MVSLVLSLVGSEVSRGLLWCHLLCHLVEVKCEVEVYCVTAVSQ